MKTLTTILFLLLATPSFADPGDADHPRRAEVNGRLANQTKRIDDGVKSGRLSQQQANQLHRDDNKIHAKEHADAAAHGGHITAGEQRSLNRQENATNREIRKEKTVK